MQSVNQCVYVRELDEGFAEKNMRKYTKLPNVNGKYIKQNDGRWLNHDGSSVIVNLGNSKGGFSGCYANNGRENDDCHPSNMWGQFENRLESDEQNIYHWEKHNFGTLNTACVSK